MLTPEPKAGQRWISESEPELGLGLLVRTTSERIEVQFSAAGESRHYAADNAPLRRVRFRVGERIETNDGRQLTVEEVTDRAGLLVYCAAGAELPESELSDRTMFNRPEERLLAGLTDDAALFTLRRRTLEHRHRRRKSPVRGFLGGRIDLIPHQMYIAHEVSSRHAPRILLSDEVGLGKTIEACLILHRLLLSGRVSRVLILTPETLVHQWFVEMLRKFNTWLHIFDEARCASIEGASPDSNPFGDDQLILCSLQFLAGFPKRAAQALEEEWDILVVDEAHHLEWSLGAASPEYLLVEALGKRAAGLLLLTATPEQFGPEGHFARLRLLDPDRYSDFDAFTRQAQEYRPVAAIAEKLHSKQKIEPTDIEFLKERFPHEEEAIARAAAAIEAGDAAAREALLGRVLDLHGPGRVIFRNRRGAMSGFPKRIVHLSRLRASEEHDVWLDRVSTEFAIDAGDAQLQIQYDLGKDPRVTWLHGLLIELDPEKILVICRSRQKALALESALRLHSNVAMGVFHEDLTLVQRDRNAAWFSEQEGARVLICSEIGSEGRNFQFAHHLVLFDLPLNPELLEQRIGRLDRIGQKQEIHIHVPFLDQSPQEVLARWYDEGLNAFEDHVAGGHELLRQFGRQLHDLALEFPAKPREEAASEMAGLLQRTSRARLRLVQHYEQGRDRLLELNSFRPERALSLIDAIRAEDQDGALEEFMLGVFDWYGVHLEELAPRTYFLNADGALTEAFPSIPAEGVTATFDRQRAIGREDVAFLTWDHPMVTGAMDLISGAESGNSSFGLWVSQERGLFLECLFVVETVAPSKLHADRFQPATPIRVVVNHAGDDATAEHPESLFDAVLAKGSMYSLLDKPGVASEVLPLMFEAATSLAQSRAAAVSSEGTRRMRAVLEAEINRLRALQKTNPNIRREEIAMAESQRERLTEALAGARLRLDAVRLILKGPR